MVAPIHTGIMAVVFIMLVLTTGTIYEKDCKTITKPSQDELNAGFWVCSYDSEARPIFCGSNAKEFQTLNEIPSDWNLKNEPKFKCKDEADSSMGITLTSVQLGANAPVTQLVASRQEGSNTYYTEVA